MPTYTPHRKVLYQVRGRLQEAHHLISESFDEREFPEHFPHRDAAEKIAEAIKSLNRLIDCVAGEIVKENASHA